jgi:anti-sigma factor RsiW
MDQSEKDNLEFELNQYLDGELSGRRARKLERRIRVDPALQEELKKYAALEGRLSALGAGELPGADYDSQRAEVLHALERRALLERPRRRIIIFRPVFAAVSGGLAIAAAIIVGLTLWLSSPAPVAAPGPLAVHPSGHPQQPIQAPAAAPTEILVAMSRMDAVDYHLPEVSAGVEPQEAASEPEPPPGTVLVSAGPPGQPEGEDDAFPFPVGF